MQAKKSIYAIGVQVTEEEKKRAKRKTLDLKKKYGVTRNEVLKMIIVDFLDDKDIIEILKLKGKLKTKVINYRK